MMKRLWAALGAVTLLLASTAGWAAVVDPGQSTFIGNVAVPNFVLVSTAQTGVDKCTFIGNSCVPNVVLIDPATGLPAVASGSTVGTVTPLDASNSAPRNTQKVYGSVSMQAGSNVLTCAACTFVSADVGKHIVVSHAGATGTTGAVTAVPVTAPGSYTAQPSIVLTSGSGGYGIIRPLMYALTATVNAAGSGYTNGTQTLTLNAAGCNTPVQLSVTVAGGIVTAVGSIANAGSCWNINSTGATAVSSSGGGGFSATFNLTWGVASASIMAGGWGYPLDGSVTAAMSGGTFTSAATLGAVTVTPPIAWLPSTIAGYTDSHHVTLAANALTSTSGSQYARWGGDDQPAIQAAMNAACTSGKKASVFLPGDGWGIASDLTIPDGCNLVVFGSGRYTTTITALGALNVNAGGAAAGATALTDMIFKANDNGDIAIRELSLDASHLVAAPLFLHGAHGGVLASIDILNPAPQVANGAGLIIGDPVNYFYASGLTVSNLVVEDRVGQTTADLPLIGIGSYTPDNVFGDNITAINAALYNIYDSGNSAWTAPHPFNYPTNMLSQYTFWAAGSVRMDRPYFDTGAVAGFHATYNAAVQMTSPFCFWASGPGPSSSCIEIASGSGGLSIKGAAVGNNGFPGANVVTHLGTPSQAEDISTALGATGSSFVSGGQRGGAYYSLDTADSLTTGGNARGLYAFDGQQWGNGNCRTAAAQVAAGLGSVAIGCGNKITSAGTYASAIGGFNTVDAPISAAQGQAGQTNGRSGCFVFGGGSVSSTKPLQYMHCVLGAQVADTAAHRIWVNNSASFLNSLNLPQKDTYRLDAKVHCGADTSFTDVGEFHFPPVSFSRATGAVFATMTPATVSAVTDGGTTAGQAATVTLTNDTTTYPGPNFSVTIPSASAGNPWICTVEADLIEAM